MVPAWLLWVLAFAALWYLLMRSGAADPADVSEGDIVHGVVGRPGMGKSYKLTEGAVWSLRKAQRRERNGGKPIRVVTNFEVGQRVWSHVVRRSYLSDHGWPLAGETMVPCFAPRKGKRRCTVPIHAPAFWPDKRVEVIHLLSDLLKVKARTDRWTREPLEEVHCYIDEAHQLASARFWQETGREVLAYFSQVRKAGVFLVWSSQSAKNVETSLRRVTTAVTTCSIVIVPVVGKVLITKRYLYELLDDDEEAHNALWWTMRIRRFRTSVAEAFETHRVFDIVNDVKRERSAPSGARRRAPERAET